MKSARSHSTSGYVSAPSRTECGALSRGDASLPLCRCSQWQRGRWTGSIDFDSAHIEKGKPGVWMLWGPTRVRKSPTVPPLPTTPSKPFIQTGAVSVQTPSLWNVLALSSPTPTTSQPAPKQEYSAEDAQHRRRLPTWIQPGFYLNCRQDFETVSMVFPHCPKCGAVVGAIRSRCFVEALCLGKYELRS